MPDGSQVPLKQFKGKVVALAFISVTCPHCQQLTQALNGIQKDYAARGVQVLESAMGGDPLSVRSFAAQYGVMFPVGFNDHATVLTFLQAPIIQPGYVPKMAFIDRKGVIQAQYQGENPFFQDQDKNVRAQLDKLLAASPARAMKKTAKKK